MSTKAELTQKIIEYNAMSVVRDTPERTLEIAKACWDGGVKMIEVSFTVNTALDSIKMIHDELPDMLVAAGTVLDPVTARLAILGGVDMILSPEFNLDVAKMCNLYQIPYGPGCNSVSEMTEALTYGASFIKVFPGSSQEGPSLFKTVGTPIPNMPLLASGGINLDNLVDFLQAGSVVNCFGSLLAKGDKETITNNAKQVMKIISDFRENNE